MSNSKLDGIALGRVTRQSSFAASVIAQGACAGFTHHICIPDGGGRAEEQFREVPSDRSEHSRITMPRCREDWEIMSQ